jgi:hypothetical protein
LDNSSQTIDSQKGNEKKHLSKVIRFTKRYMLFPLLGLSYLLLSYNFFGGWWNSSLGTIAIIVLSYLIWDKGFLYRSGLKMKPLVILKSIIFAAVLTSVTYLLMKYIANKEGVFIEYTDWRSYYHDIFYVLNEEIVLGAIPLFLLVDKWKQKPLIASVILALLFSVIHFVFYKWVFLDRGIIQISTLVTLFFVGIIRNNLIITTGHIGYSWALHFSWIVIMFGSAHQFIADNSRVTEPDRFNMYLGSYELLVVSTILVVLSIIHLVKRGKADNGENM